jgi:glycerol-3-phosphate acyltransferase PlsY
MLQAYVSSVLDILEVCSECVRMDVAKVDRDVAYVTMVVHVCCKHLFPMFYLFFQGKCVYLDVVYVLHIICCKCLILMLCIFLMVLKCF